MGNGQRFDSSSAPMFLRPIARSPWRVRRICLQTLTEAQSQNHKPRSIHNDTPPFPTIPTCPSPSCNCAAMPAMPEGLPIDHTKSLNGTMAPYAEQVLICTGKDDWLSKIEDEIHHETLDQPHEIGTRNEGGEAKSSARVGLISHIGGHKFAGNVILYIPPGAKTADGKAHELA